MRNEFVEQVLSGLLTTELIALERVTGDDTKVRAHVKRKTFPKPGRLLVYEEEVAKDVATIEADEARQESNARQQAARKRTARERTERVKEALEEETRPRTAQNGRLGGSSRRRHCLRLKSAKCCLGKAHSKASLCLGPPAKGPTWIFHRDRTGAVYGSGNT